MASTPGVARAIARNSAPVIEGTEIAKALERTAAPRAVSVVLSRSAIAAIAVMFLLMGMVVAGYGPLFEHLSRRYGVSLPVAGATISVYFAGSLPGVLVAMRVFARMAARRIVMVAMAVASAGLVGAAFAGTWPLFLGAIFVVGLGFGALVLGLNQVVAYSAGERRTALLNGLNSCYSAGAVAGPIIVASFAAAHFSLLFVVAAALWLVLIPGAAGISGRLPVIGGSRRRPDALTAIFICAFVLYVGVENGTGGWMPSHLESVGLRPGGAATVTSGFWLALVTGRLLMTLVPASVPERVIVLAAAVAGAIALLAATIPAVAPVAYIATGLAIAPIFPTGIVWLARLRPGDSSATSWLYPASSIGGVAGPGAIGVVIAQAGVGWAPLVLAIVAAGMSLAFWFAARR